MILDYIKLLRPQQWYKNIVIFLPLFFVGELFDTTAWKPMLLGFVALCLISSVNYIINDIVDMKKDRLHPDNRDRPLPSGRVLLIEAIVIALLLYIGSTLISVFLPYKFLYVVLFLFVFTQFYSFWLKKEPFADIIAISVNFVARTTAGAYILSGELSPWLILCPFFLALLMAVAKRKATLVMMGREAAIKHRAVLKYYTEGIINSFIFISATCLIISYVLFAFLNRGQNLLIATIPVAVYVILKYIYHVYEGNEIAKNPLYAYKDVMLCLACVGWGFITFVIMYF